MTDRVPNSRYEWLNAQIDDATKDSEMYSTEKFVRSLKPTAVKDLRRMGRTPVQDNLGTVTLVERNGVLRWVDGLGFRQEIHGGRRRRGPKRPGNIVKQLKFERLDNNSVGGALQRLDQKLNSKSGMRVWSDPKRARAGKPKSNGRILLLVHGTFSKTEAIMDGLNETDDGRKFFANAKRHYDQILSFDHPTISVSPVINAIDLSRELSSTEASIDVICHSRGGLVVRWWLEALLNDRSRVGKIIFVGSPLAGTSLAAPPRLRAGLDLLTNVANVLGKGSQVVSSVFPLFVAVTGILKVFGSITKVAARTPLIDAAVYMIPGLVAQSRTGDNSGIVRMRQGAQESLKKSYYAVASDFEPTSPGWAFWQYFQKPGQRLADIGADMVFEGANDLVVDTISMSQLSDNMEMLKTHVFSDFGARDIVHHLNYFEQPKVIGFFEKTLGLE